MARKPCERLPKDQAGRPYQYYGLLAPYSARPEHLALPISLGGAGYDLLWRRDACHLGTCRGAECFGEVLWVDKSGKRGLRHF